MVPHLEHTEPVFLGNAVAAGVHMWVLVQDTHKREGAKHYVTLDTTSFDRCFYLNTLGLMNLLLQASTPSNQLCFTFLLPAPPQDLNQAPLGAQQLTRPDFSNLPHFAHDIILAIVGVMGGVMIGVPVMSSLSGIGRRDAYRRVICRVPSTGVDIHTVCDIDPGEPKNMSFMLATE